MQKRQNRRQFQQQSNQQPLVNFTGYGPSGWTRGDEFIEDAICTRLTADMSLDATGIQVEVQEGNVTLTGYVPTARARQTASTIAMSAYGVRNLNNHLEIGVAASLPHQQSEQQRTAGAGAPKSRT